MDTDFRLAYTSAVREYMDTYADKFCPRTYGSAGVVEQYVNSNGIEISTENIWNKPDAHVVDVKDNRIVIYRSEHCTATLVHELGHWLERYIKRNLDFSAIFFIYAYL